MGQQKPSLSFTQKFIVYLIFLSLLPLLVLGYSTYRASGSTLRNEAARYTAELVTNQQDYLELQMAQVESLIANISGVEEITNVLDNENSPNDTFTDLATQARIGYILNSYSNLKGLVSIDIFTTGDDRYHVGDTLNVEDIRNDVKDKIFAEALESDKLVYWAGIEDNVNANSSYKKVVTAAKVLTRIDRTTLQQEPIALILVNYSVDYLYEHFNNIQFDEGAYLMVIDAQDRVIFHPDKAIIGSRIDAGLKAQLYRPHDHQSAVDAFETNINGQRMLINHIHSKNNGWIVVSLIPVSTLAAKTKSIGTTTIWVFLVSLGIAGMAALVVNRSVVNPIQQVTNQFKRFQNGSLDQQIQLPVRSRDEIGELVQWFNVFVENLAVRQKMEHALQKSEKQYRDVFEAVTDGLVIMNDNAIVMANSTACQMHGYLCEEFVTLRPLTLIHTHYHNQFTDFLDAIEAGRKAHTSVVNIRKDGTTLDVEIHGAPIDYQGQPHQLLILHDITERLQTEEAMRRTQKLESLGVLAGGIAHDFNNLLVAMMAQTSLALVKLPPGSEAFPHIDKAVKAAEHAADLTRQMLAYSGRGQFERHTIDLNKLLEENLHLLQTGIPK
ncbi:MAG: PAS domain S-box protein, partial [Anaerolineae bacterium]